jgi:hypothetical protein
LKYSTQMFYWAITIIIPEMPANKNPFLKAPQKMTMN